MLVLIASHRAHQFRKNESERQALRVQFFAIFHLFLGLDFITETALPGWQQARQGNIWI